MIDQKYQTKQVTQRQKCSKTAVEVEKKGTTFGENIRPGQFDPYMEISHWQESKSRKISRRNDSLFSLSLEKIKFSFLFLFSIFKIFRKKCNFSSRFVRFLNPFSFSSWFSRFLRTISLSLLDWWDSETQISFSSRFSRCWEKILFLFSIYEIFENNFLSLLNLQDFSKQIERWVGGL